MNGLNMEDVSKIAWCCHHKPRYCHCRLDRQSKHIACVNRLPIRSAMTNMVGNDEEKDITKGKKKI